MKRIDFEIFYHTEFGLAVEKRKCHLGDTPETTFRNAWKSLPKRICRRKECLEFDQNGKHYLVFFSTLKENRFDFELSAEVSELSE